MLTQAGSGHPGGSLSAVEILTVLFFNHMHGWSQDPYPSRDRFVLSKGHAAPALYAVFAELGILDPEELLSFRRLNSRLQGHPDRRRFPLVEASTGSLGQGLSIALGLALGLDAIPVTCLLGDGEMQEGQVWEACAAASRYQLHQLTMIIDANGLQIDGRVEDVMPLEPLDQKLRAFGWQVFEINGHDMDALKVALSVPTHEPKAIIARTIKGKGVSFMEGVASWHGKAPNPAELKAALEELSA